MKVIGRNLPWESTDQTTWGVGLALTWDLFDGGARKRKLEMARAERDAARHELEDAKDKAISQVWQYYTSTKLAFRRLDVAAALLDASEKSYQQTFEGYQNGLNSLVDVLDAERALSSARYTQLDTRATLLESTAALAFASGDLGPRLIHRKPGTLDTQTMKLRHSFLLVALMLLAGCRGAPQINLLGSFFPAWMLSRWHRDRRNSAAAPGLCSRQTRTSPGPAPTGLFLPLGAADSRVLADLFQGLTYERHKTITERTQPRPKER